MMKVFEGNSRKTEPANCDNRIEFVKKNRTERTKASLRHIRTIHRIKADGLGPCYRALGDSMWQILCDIYLCDIDGIDFSVSDLERSLKLSATLAERYVAVLVSEAWLEVTASEGDSDSRNLLLTETGRSRVDSILARCTDAFTEGFIYSRPKLVKSGD